MTDCGEAPLMCGSIVTNGYSRACVKPLGHKDAHWDGKSMAWTRVPWVWRPPTGNTTRT